MATRRPMTLGSSAAAVGGAAAMLRGVTADSGGQGLKMPELGSSAAGWQRNFPDDLFLFLYTN